MGTASTSSSSCYLLLSLAVCSPHLFAWIHSAGKKEAAAAAKKSKQAAAKTASAEGSDDDAAAAEEEEDEDEEDEQEGGGAGGSKSALQVTSALVDGWTQAALDKASLGAMMQLVKAYR